MTDLEERIRQIADYHATDWARRLEEVGGPGVGGTQLESKPFFVQKADTRDEYTRAALERSISELWGEAAWCYVYGLFRASIVVSAILLEVTLKYELYRRGVGTRNKTLGILIKISKEKDLIPRETADLARSINDRRNAVVHANIQMDRPESLLHHTGPEHEIEPLEDLSRNVTPEGWLTGDGETIAIDFGSKSQTQRYSLVFAFRRAARDNLFQVREILRYLYPRSD